MYAEAAAQMIAKVISGESLESILASRLEGAPVPDESRTQMLEFLFVSDIQSTFDKLANLGNMFEEICREWCLPTYLGALAKEHAIR